MFGQGEIGQMKNNEEKIKEKMGSCVLWLGGGKRKYLGGAQHFLPKPTQNFWGYQQNNVGEGKNIIS